MKLGRGSLLSLLRQFKSLMMLQPVQQMKLMGTNAMMIRVLARLFKETTHCRQCSFGEFFARLFKEATNCRQCSPLAGDDFMLDDTEFGERAPKTPKLAEDELKRSIAAVTSTDLDLYEHDDEDLKGCFGEDELESLERYDMEFEEKWYDVGELDDDDDDDDEVTKQFTFAYEKHEPQVSPDELIRLDALADSLELKRLFTR
eukprot:s4053_g7.t1